MQTAEFIPQNTLYPSSKYTVTLMGRAVTTSQCSNSNKIKNAELHFETCCPAPKTIGIKLKEQGDVVMVAGRGGECGNGGRKGRGKGGRR